MNKPAHRFSPDMVDRFGDTCPPKEAKGVHQVIYRGVKNPPISARHFVSHAEGKLPKHDLANCDHWGLSVWTSRKDVDHARKAYSYVRRWGIAEGKVTPDDGVLLATPNDGNPNHHTFWTYFDRNLADSFTLIISPAN